MQTPEHLEASPRRLIEKTLKSRHPHTVAELAGIILSENKIDEMEFVAAVRAMEEEGLLFLRKPSYRTESVLDYALAPTLSGWLWLTLAVTILTIITVDTAPEFFPFNIVRLVMASIFLMYLPGYALIHLLFSETTKLNELERFGLNIALSLIVVPLIGVILDYTYWGIRLPVLMTCVAAFTIVVAIAASVRAYVQIKKMG